MAKCGFAENVCYLSLSRLSPNFYNFLGSYEPKKSSLQGYQCTVNISAIRQLNQAWKVFL